jgi:hypothetical protein
MSELAPELRQQIDLSTSDLAIAGLKLDQLAVAKGGQALARHARREVQKLEYNGVHTIEAIRDVYRQVAQDKF